MSHITNPLQPLPKGGEIIRKVIWAILPTNMGHITNQYGPYYFPIRLIRPISHILPISPTGNSSPLGGLRGGTAAGVFQPSLYSPVRIDAITPPSISRSVPVMKRACSPSRKAAAFAYLAVENLLHQSVVLLGVWHCVVDVEHQSGIAQSTLELFGGGLSWVYCKSFHVFRLFFRLQK